MNRVMLVLDLAKHTTGWVLWDIENETHPLVKHGLLEPKVPRKFKGAEKDRVHYNQMSDWVHEMCITYNPALVVFEITDWHQRLMQSGRPVPNWESLYKRERVVREALGGARTAILHGVPQTVSVEQIGVKVVRESIEAVKKTGVARRLWELYQDQFEWHDKEGTVSFNGVMLSHDETDAAALAHVATSEFRLRELICSSAP